MGRKKITALSSIFGLAIGSLATLLWLLGGAAIAYADPVNRFVATTGSDSANDCATSSSPCQTIQHAVDQAASGDIILVATGVYSDLHSRPVPETYLAPAELDWVIQIVFIDKSLTIQGGYAAGFTEPPDPENNPTTLDAQNGGRGILVTSEITATLSGLRLTGGNAAGLYGEGGPHDAGGGLYSTYATTILTNNEVFSNTAYYGGGLFLRYGTETLENNTIYSNTAYFGGGARLYRSEAVTIAENTIEMNTADAGGGLVVDYCYNTMVDSNSIISNTATESMGGGLYLNVISGTIQSNDILSNSSEDQGGGVLLYASHNGTLISNTITGNTAEDGGGIRVYQGDSTLIGNTITGNTAESGGGVEMWYSDATLLGNIIMDNTATAGGGCGMTIGLSDATLINNVIANNATSASTGSGLAIRGASPQLVHNTIADNGGTQGYGVSVGSYLSTDSSPVLTNTILTGHNWGVSVSTGNTASLEGTLWENTYDWHGTGTVLTGTHNLWGDPRFAGDGYHLLSNSPAIDQGIDAGISNDLEGDARPYGTGPDLGADEFTGTIIQPAYWVHLPIGMKDLATPLLGVADE